MAFLYRRPSLCQWSEGSFRQRVVDIHGKLSGKLSATSEQEGVSCYSIISHNLPSHFHVIHRLLIQLHPFTACISVDAVAAYVPLCTAICCLWPHGCPQSTFRLGAPVHTHTPVTAPPPQQWAWMASFCISQSSAFSPDTGCVALQGLRLTLFSFL